MYRKILFALALLLVCSGAVARDEKKKQQPAQPAPIEWKAFSDYMFHEGTAVLRGRLTGYAEGERPEVVEVIHYNHFHRSKQYPEVTPVESDGTFYIELQLAHSQFVLVRTLHTNLFLTVGDTLDVEYDHSKYDDNRWRFGGDATPVQVNTHWNALEQRHYANIPQSNRKREKGEEDFRQLMQYYEGRLDTLSHLVAEGSLDLPEGLTPQAREVLQYGLLSHAYAEALDLYLDYMLRDTDNRLSVVDEKASQDKTIYGLFPKYEQAVLNTPMILLTPETWIPFNRLLITLYLNISHSGLRDVSFDTDSLVAVAPTKDTARLAQEYLLVQMSFLWPRYYSRALDTAVRTFMPDEANTLGEHYREKFRDLEQKKGLHRTFSSDLALAALLMKWHEDVENEDELSAEGADMFLNRLTCILDEVRHPLVRHRLMQVYHDFILRHKAPATAKDDAQITDSTLLNLIAPYKGMWLCIDFWGMGCGPCRMSMLHSREDVAQLVGKPARVLYVATREDGHQEAAEKWMLENDIRGEHLFISKDDMSRLRAYLKFGTVSFSIIVDDEGRIVKRETGPHYLLEMLNKN